MEELPKNFDAATKKNIQAWLEGPYEKTSKQQIRSLIKSNPEELINAFYKSLSFGTAGARGIMGIGTNRLNIYTIRLMTQGVANYLKKIGNDKKTAVLIGYDNRNHSREFAIETAKVFSGNAIHVYIFKELRPVPLVSFGCREKKCMAAVMITASHNPPEYNGYKVYWKDGGQILPPHDSGIIKEVSNINSLEQVKMSDSNIEWIDTELDEKYYRKLQPMQMAKEALKDGSNLHYIYSNFHGTGITLLPKAAKQWGYGHMDLVEKQASIDGNFPYAKKPNPEEKKSLQPGIDQMLKANADLFIATDPDADRIGVVINHHGKEHILSGNQLACLLLDHLCKHQKDLPKNAAAVKSIVTTDLFEEICKSYHVKCFNVLTGFKYIAEKIEQFEKDSSHTYIFGAEESYGYLCETFVRDKDAISASCFLLEMAYLQKKEGKTLLDLLDTLYQKYGFYLEKTVSIPFEESAKGMNKMKGVMEKLHQSHPQNLGNVSIMSVEDYLKRESLDLQTKKIEPIALPKSDVLAYRLSDMSKIIIRPSGTEPKIKLYIHVMEKNIQDREKASRICLERIEAYRESVQNEWFS